MELFEAPDEFFKVFALPDIYSSLSPKATFICELVIEKQETLTEVPPKKARGIISRELRQLGWFWSDIWQSFAELKEVL